MKERRRSSYTGEVLRRYEEWEASELLKKGLKVLELDLESARKLRHNDERKQGLAWLVKAHTVAGDEWLQKELSMGHRSNISCAVGRYRDEKDRRIQKLKRILHMCPD